MPSTSPTLKVRPLTGTTQPPDYYESGAPGPSSAGAYAPAPADEQQQQQQQVKPPTEFEEPPMDLSTQALTLGVSDSAMDAANTFDDKYDHFTGRTHRHLDRLIERPQSRTTGLRWDGGLERIRRHRFVMPVEPPYDPFEGDRYRLPFDRSQWESWRKGGLVAPKQTTRVPKKQKWNLRTSCWRPRFMHGNSRDLFETLEAMRKLFEADWAIASRAHGLAWMIVKTSHESSTWRQLDRAAEHPEVAEVMEMLWRHHKVIYNAFDYYSSLFSEIELAAGEPDVFNISFNAFMSFCRDCKLITKRCPVGDLEVIWAVVNASDDGTKEIDRHNSKLTLNRQEWLQALVRAAVAVHIPKGECGDVSDAVEQLFTQNVCAPNLPPTALQDSNEFRKKVCYTKAVSTALEVYEGSLKSMYGKYAEVSQDQNDVLRDDALMSIGEWLAFCHHMGFIPSGQLSELDAKNIFLWSRIRAASDDLRNLNVDGVDREGMAAKKVSQRAAEEARVNSIIDKCEKRLRHLFAADFLEALVRLATMIALPTDEEIEEAGAVDAGDFLIAMQRSSPVAFKEFQTTHKPKHIWPDCTDWVKSKNQQPVFKCVEHLLKLIVRTVEYNTSALRDESMADGAIDESEIDRFVRLRQSGGRLELKSKLDEELDFAEVIESAALKKLMVAAAITIQLARRAKQARAKVRAKREEMQASGGAAPAPAPAAAALAPAPAPYNFQPFVSES